jgi:DUF4097 and DUF4098 domain-containing protein YvlB
MTTTQGGRRRRGGTGLRRIAVAIVLLLLPAAIELTAQDRTRSSARTEQTVSVSRGTRLRLDNQAGSVTVRAWDKDAVRVQAEHGSNVQVSIRNARSVLRIDSDATSGKLGRVVYEIAVPKWMPVSVETTFDDITVEGTESDVSVETVRGHVMIKGGSGSVKAESVQGRVVVEGARGRIEASSVSDLIKLDTVTGEISADATNGAISLVRIQSSMVDANTVNGSITFDGKIADDGHYGFSTHNGDIVVAIPPSANVTFDVITYHGRFAPDLPLKGSAPRRRGDHAVYTLGTGAAQMELESFGGSIKVIEGGSAQPSAKQEK